MPQLEERTAKIEGILEQMSNRINDLWTEVSSLRADFNSLRADLDTKVEGLRKDIHDNFRWTMATLIGSWATIVGIIIAMFAIMRR